MLPIHTYEAWLEHTKSWFYSQVRSIFMPEGDFNDFTRDRRCTMDTLANKTALVTGASRGMGRATALALAAAGARVIIHYGRNADEAKAVVDQIRATSGRADAVAADLAAPDGAHVLAAQVRNLIGNRLDILVSNAAISRAAPIESITVK